MRLLLQVVIILAVCLVAMALPAAGAQAADGGAYITLDPEDGVPGTIVTVYVGNFTAGEWVDVYYYLDTTNTTNRILVQSKEVPGSRSFRFTFTIPESCRGDHRVRAEEDSPSAYVAWAVFTVNPGLTVSPAEGPVGTNVTVKGQGFAKNETRIEVSYYLNSTDSKVMPGNVTANATGTWEKKFEIPASPMGNHKIDAKGNNSSLAAVQEVFFKVTPGTSLDRSSGTVGDNITMTGNGFDSDDTHITILFAGKEVQTGINASAQGYWQASFGVPEMAAGAYNVTAYGDSTPKEAVRVSSFAIKPGILLSAEEGYVGMSLTVTGRGFAANKDVAVTYDGVQKTTAPTDDKGNFEASFTVPESQHGGHPIAARDAAGNNATAPFTMESKAPDTPELKSPADGNWVGFIGRVRPAFNWSAVFDESGVYYNLQIATIANVTATGFANFTVSVPHIVGTNYTLNATEALEYGTYYWIVQAVDRAGNAGDWTPAWSFRAGLLPLWGFIVAIVAIVVLIGALVYFFVRRRRTHYY